MFDVTLTFDNGPDPQVTPAVLDVLTDTCVKATFFVLGEKVSVRENLALARKAHELGHWIGNHTFTHKVPLGQCDADTAISEIARTQAALDGLAHPDKLFRPFGGGGCLGPHLFNAPAIRFLEAQHYTCVLWTAVPRDWEDPDGWIDTAIRQIKDQAHAVVVLHDLPTGAMRHLGTFITRVRGLGGRFRQDFPPACLPLRNGRKIQDMQSYITC